MDVDILEEPSSKTFTETFYEVFPFYLSIGMTYEQFWENDPSLAKYYREADKLRNERKNTDAWIQGMYIYDAVSTVVYNVWCRDKGKSPAKYTEKPYQFNAVKAKEDLVEEESARAEVWMKNFVNRFK
ncbi:hypothetical protein [Thomasclavelia ramosa]|uniref:hypothetical protein n=1 Tax=Thomasclavelia ramosa TaxID=1547 RepID=UPI000E4050DE|nr:hypothetical protein [Thomasclavelia ramosa]RGC89214.1 hypothetical protein DW242_09785 [Thomasclavelia ramosa]